ncbi:heterodisulfide reductase subunit A [Thermosulfidibacter takaii ABI70S6]|uniref:Heterodisulfide reductase subunit A n=1 Tax=Thermosulfidibacter takaii (strain DSM 17441 / JCM 13301 / NBRC 103674 / ABI70S6) TaxID=1298851 RepID=A0A0S3QVH1_THET7|nr:FAD-dependent oxidoreductase [Thermosulfidibacter takaii]BAT72306.1 heterodisulfide reductase subunit A [Thermosulfidibacter takaii ABI70S6]
MGAEPRVGVYICHCGINIAYKVDVEAVRDYAATLPHVVVARDYKFMCSNVGQEMIINDIKEYNLNRVVVASCSPRMHEKTFRKACEKGGINPYLFQMASIREQVSWVHEDEKVATEKAKELVRAAVFRVIHHEPLERRFVDINPNVLVIGGGIAGMQAALEIADAGKTVYLVEREPSIGGHMAKFDKTFPTLDCAACIMTPKMVSVGQHENIKLLTNAEVESVEGFIGNFKVRIRKKARYVDEDKCTGCGECAKVCPVSLPNEFEYGMNERKAIYRPFPQAVPNVFTISKEGYSPCRNACPAGLNAHGYVKLIGEGKYKEAFALIMDRVVLPASLGRACPAFCERECTRNEAGGSIHIRLLKRFAADWYYENVGTTSPFEPVEPKDERVAVVGAGPAGLACAFYLARQGYKVTIFEKEAEPGGMVRYAIPEYRVPKDVLTKDIEVIKSMGVEIKTNTPVGEEGISIDELFSQGYKAVFLGIGAWKDRRLNVPGEDLEGIYTSIEFLKQVNTGQKPNLGKKVAVIGGGNSAIDAARVAKRLGADVTIYYRRTRKEMPAFPEEVEAALQEGINIEFLTTPVGFEGNGKVQKMELIRMELGEPDESGRRRPIPIEGSNYKVDVDSVILAIGQIPYSEGFEKFGVELNRNGTIKADPETLQTSREGVFAGGDAVTGPSTIVEAIGYGRKAAYYIDKFLKGEDLKQVEPYDANKLPTVDKRKVFDRKPVEVVARPKVRELPVEERITNFKEVEQPLTEEEAQAEGKRCLDCAGCCECRQCEAACEAMAIMHEQRDEIIEVEVGSIIVATGFRTFDPTPLKRYGYKKYPEVYTSIEFERLNNAAGPTEGKIVMKNGKVPESVAIIHCVGSRDEKFHRYCSRVCCMYSMKYAHLIREKTGAEVYEFYIDIRSPGKMYEEFYNRVQEEGTHFIRGKVAEVTDIAETPEEEGKLIVVVEDTLSGKVRRVPVDMVILSVALEPAVGAEELARILGISQDQDGWFIELHPKLAPVSTASDGIFLAGCCQGPKDIPDTVAQASGAAAEALSLIMRGKVEIEAATSYIDPEVCVGCQQCREVCAYSAIDYDPSRGVCVVNEALCKGCGLCAATCPNKAITLKHFKNEQILHELEGILL